MNSNPKAIITIAKFARICGIFLIPLGLGGSFQVSGALPSLIYLAGFVLLGIGLIIWGTLVIRRLK
jgi:hypothetical protein